MKLTPGQFNIKAWNQFLVCDYFKQTAVRPANYFRKRIISPLGQQRPITHLRRWKLLSLADTISKERTKQTFGSTVNKKSS